MDKKLYHGQKFELLRHFETCNEIVVEESSAARHDLSVYTKSQITDGLKTFNDFGATLYNRILSNSKKYTRVDVIADQYFELSLKSNAFKKLII